jgi:hypothetical protein
MGLVTAGMMSLLIFSIKFYQRNGWRMQINQDVRQLTDELVDNTTAANYAKIFKDYTTVIDATSGTNKLGPIISDRFAGGFLLLVYTAATDDTKIERIVAYYTYPDPVDPTLNTLRKLDKQFTAITTPAWGASLATLIASTGDFANGLQIMPVTAAQKLSAASKGTIVPTDEQIADWVAAGNTAASCPLTPFTNFMNTSIVIMCKFKYVGNNGVNQAVVNTYNFTVSPRG